MPPITLDEALMTLDGKGPVLAIAREVSAILREAKIEGAIIGGVAVGLHGYLRTTNDVDVVVIGDSSRLAEQLVQHDFEFEAEHKQFVKSGVPVHLVNIEQLGQPPKRVIEIDGVCTVSLADLISIKLRSGTANMLRAQDLGDVIGLIRHHGLSSAFASQVEPDVRREFRKFVDAIKREQGS
jgi:hypothetical protein